MSLDRVVVVRKSPQSLRGICKARSTSWASLAPAHLSSDLTQLLVLERVVLSVVWVALQLWALSARPVAQTTPVSLVAWAEVLSLVLLEASRELLAVALVDWPLLLVSKEETLPLVELQAVPLALLTEQIVVRGVVVSAVVVEQPEEELLFSRAIFLYLQVRMVLHR